jgi:hypothetical protein
VGWEALLLLALGRNFEAGEQVPDFIKGWRWGSQDTRGEDLEALCWDLPALRRSDGASTFSRSQGLPSTA